jgi:hypothetical protein
MSRKDRTIEMTDSRGERRGKFRFPIRREVRYKVLSEGDGVKSGAGYTIDIGSGGVLFSLECDVAPGAFIQLSISWPVLLEDSCPMRLIVFGRVLRSVECSCACTVDRYEFRTQARATHPANTRHDTALERWVDALRKDHPKLRVGLTHPLLLVG